jgi:hypothetical protein
MRSAPRLILGLVVGFTGLSIVRAADVAADKPPEPLQGPGVRPGYPDAFTLAYIVAPESISPNGKFGIIFDYNLSAVSDTDARNYLIAIKPVRILGMLNCDPYFAGKNHGDLTVTWAPDNRAVLVTIGSKWGPGAVELVQLSDDRIENETPMLDRVYALLRSDYQKCGAERFNDYLAYLIDDDEDDSWTFDHQGQLHVDCTAVTNPKRDPNEKSWSAKFHGIWNVKEGRFVQQRVTRTFCGTYKGE